MYDKTNHLILGNEAREKILEGMNKTADAVKTTLGGRGRTAIIQKEFGIPTVTKDGVTVAKAINFKDNSLKTGAQLIKEVASKTNYEAGDGTTTATVLAQELTREGMKYLAAGFDPIQLKREMDESSKVIIDEIEKSKKTISEREEIKNIAKVSSNNDEEIATLIDNVIDLVGEDGVVTIETSPDYTTFAKVEEGMGIHKGFISPYLVTNIERNEAVLEDAIVLIYNGTINTVQPLVPILSSAVKNNKKILLIANEIDDSVLHVLIQNKLQNNLGICAIKSPEVGQERLNILADIASFTGATVMGKTEGIPLEKMSTDHLGGVKKVVCGREQTTLVGGMGAKKKIDERVSIIKKSMKEKSNEFELERLQKRLASLVGGIGVLYVGAMTEPEMKEKKDRVEDALNATRAAIEDGIVEGGGICLAKIANQLKAETNGCKIIKHALLSPLKQIVANAGGRVDVVVDAVEQKECGFDVKSMEYVQDMFEAGIIDPAKVTKSAFLNAVSITGTVLALETAIIFDKEQKEMPMPPGPPMM